MTREEAIKRLKETRNTLQPFQYVNEAIDYAIKKLEREPILDKIRAEIEAEPYISKMEVLDIIDQYKVESEVEE